MKLKELKKVISSYNKVLLGLGSKTYNNICLEETITDWNEILELKKRLKDSPMFNNRLKEVLEGKDYFIISSAWDSNLQSSLNNRVYTPNGNIEQLQCYEACTTELWDFENLLDSSKPPKCPYCNSPLVPNIKTDAFFINSHLKEQENNYYKWIHKNYNENILVIEIESSDSDKRLIRQPFENISAALPNTFFVRVNSEYLNRPSVIKHSGSIKAKPFNFLKLIS